MNDDSAGSAAPNGSTVDLNALEPSTVQADDPVAPTLSPYKIADLCTGIAGTSIGPDDDILLAGFNSLDLVRLTGALEQSFGLQINALDVLDHPTARQLADLLHSRSQAADHGCTAEQHAGQGKHGGPTR